MDTDRVITRTEWQQRRWIAPLDIESWQRRPWRLNGLLKEEEVDEYRHLHCAHYDACLQDAIIQIRSHNETFACPKNCPGRQTFVEFETLKLSEEFEEMLRH